MVDNAGTVVKQLDYDSFGNVVRDTNPAFALVLGFAGGMTDSDHELIRFGARDYQPSAGRWTARDPILFGGGLNLYEYVQNDPINFIDRSGLQVMHETVNVSGADDNQEERYPFATEALQELYHNCTPDSSDPRCKYICLQLPEMCEENKKGPPWLRELMRSDSGCQPPAQKYDKGEAYETVTDITGVHG